jgi:hypothetical protein
MYLCMHGMQYMYILRYICDWWVYLVCVTCVLVTCGAVPVVCILKPMHELHVLGVSSLALVSWTRCLPALNFIWEGSASQTSLASVVTVPTDLTSYNVRTCVSFMYLFFCVVVISHIFVVTSKCLGVYIGPYQSYHCKCAQHLCLLWFGLLTITSGTRQKGRYAIGIRGLLVVIVTVGWPVAHLMDTLVHTSL